MAISSGTVLRVVAQMLFPDSSVMQNVFNVVVTDLVTSDAEEDVVTDCITWVEAMFTELVAYIDSGVDADEVFVYEYDAIDDDWDEVGSDIWTDAFAAVGGMSPHGVACLVIGRTIDPDVQGKKYIGGIQETSIAGSALAGLLITALTNFGVEWFTPFVGAETGGTFGPVIWSPTGTVPKVMTGASVNGISAYQRRRKPGVGI